MKVGDLVTIERATIGVPVGTTGLVRHYTPASALGYCSAGGLCGVLVLNGSVKGLTRKYFDSDLTKVQNENR